MENWYSVIQYIPNVVRGEKINIGVILHDPKSGSLKYQILDPTNTKIKSIALNKVLEDTYKVQKDYFDFFLEKIKQSDQFPLDGPNLFNKTFLKKFENMLPEEFMFSEPTYCEPSNVETFFNELLKNYIGSEYLSQFDDIINVNVKRRMKDSFSQNNLLNTKIKSNARIKPIKDLESVQYTVDFVYKNGIYNFLQALPNNSDRINEWYAKLETLLNADKGKSGFYVFYDDESEENENLHNFINHLKKDQRVNSIKLYSNEYNSLCEKIKTEGKDVSEFDLDYFAS